MKATLKLYTSQKPTKAGFPIIVQLFINASTKPKTTIGHSFLDHWNTITNEPTKQHPNYNLVIPIIKEYKAKISKINHLQYSEAEARRYLFNKSKRISSKSLIIGFIDQLIAEKTAQKKPTFSITSFRSVLNNYLDGTDMPINAITYEWLIDFKTHKLSQGCSQNGVVMYFSRLRAIYKEAQRRKSLSIKTDNPFLGLMTTTQTKSVKHIPKKMLIAFKNYQPTTKNRQHIYTIKRTVALTMFQFYIGGHDFADIALLKWTDIKKNRIVFSRTKNRNNKSAGVVVSNKLYDNALLTIAAYGNKETQRIFSFVPSPLENYKAYSIYRNNHNRTLDRISTRINCETISSKTMRYVFRTRAGKKLINDLIVMRLQGHKPKAVTFTYQGHIPNKVLDKQHYKIIKGI